MSTKPGSGRKPDQGYAWVILVVSFVSLFLSCGALYSVGVFNVIFLNEFGQAKATTSWIGSMHIGFISLMGPVSSAVSNRYGWRVATIIGGVLAGIGTWASSFSRTITQLFISFGLIAGVGHGMAYTPAMVIVGYYFNRYRTIAIGVASIGAGMGMMLFPPFIRFLSDYLSWRETLVIASCAYLQLCVLGALMWSIDIDPMEMEDEVEKRNCQCAKYSMMLNKNLLSFKFFIFCLSIFTFGIGLSTVYLHLGAFAVSSGATEKEASYLMSVLGGLSILSRMLTGIAGNDRSIPSILLYIGTLGISGIITLFWPLVARWHWGRLSFTVLFGFYGSCFNVLLAPLTVELIGLDSLTTAFGIEMVVCGVAYLLGPPIAGWLYDVSNSYSTSFYLAGVALILSAVEMMFVSLSDEKLSCTDPEMSMTKQHLVEKPKLPVSGKEQFVASKEEFVDHKEHLMGNHIEDVDQKC